MEESVQDKYNKIMAITLQKLEAPIRNSEGVLERIAMLLNISLPQKKKPPASTPQAQQIMIRLTQAENLANALLFLEGALQKLNYEPPVALVPDPTVTTAIHSRGDLESLLDAISLSGVPATPPPQPTQQQYYQMAPMYGTNPQPGYSQFDQQPVPPQQQQQQQQQQPASRAQPSRISYADYAIEDMHKVEASGFSFTDTAAAKPTPDLRGFISANRPQTQQTRPPSLNDCLNKAPTSSAPASASNNATGSGSSSSSSASAEPEVKIEEIVVPKWTKGSPSTPQEIEEYKQFMIAKYEAEQKINAEILRQRKLKEGK